MPECRNEGCTVQVHWPQPYSKGDRLLEENGTVHDCPQYNKAGSTKSGGKGYTSYKLPMEKATEVHNMALGMADAVQAHMASKEMAMTPEQFNMCYMSHFKTLSQSYKGE